MISEAHYKSHHKSLCAERTFTTSLQQLVLCGSYMQLSFFSSQQSIWSIDYQPKKNQYGPLYAIMIYGFMHAYLERRLIIHQQI